MSQSNDILEPRLVAVDSYYLSVLDDRIQDISNDCESLSMALSAIKTDDDTSKGVIVAVRAALLANSELASIISEQMSALILQPRVEVISHE
ncbi:hypothetical protein [Psychrobacter sp. S4(2024)]|uniref:hypothetical protein n=1 Tax=Psychrobacter sp. S4(2024) TaxID=3111913 RepID=UPI002FE203DE